MATTVSSTQLSIIETALSFVGCGIAGTLWWAHRHHVDLPCSADGGCTEVAASAQAYLKIGPWHDVPVALLGLLAYAALLTIGMTKLGTDSAPTRRVLHGLFWLVTMGGIGYSWYLQYVAHYVIGAFCIYCFSSALVMTTLFALATWESYVLRLFGPKRSTFDHPLTHA